MALTKNEIIRKIKTKHWISRKKKKVSPSIALYIYQYLNFTSIRRWTEEDLYLFIILNYSFSYTFFHLTFQQTSSIILVQNLVNKWRVALLHFLTRLAIGTKAARILHDLSSSETLQRQRHFRFYVALLRLNFPFVALFTSRCFEKSALREGSLIAVVLIDVLQRQFGQRLTEFQLSLILCKLYS